MKLVIAVVALFVLSAFTQTLRAQETPEPDTSGQAQPKDAKPNKVSPMKLALDGLKALDKNKPRTKGFVATPTGGSSRSTVEYAPATGGDCTTNNCRFGGGGCAICVTLEAPIPHGAKVVSATCYTSAGGPNGDVPLRSIGPCGGDWGWAAFDANYTIENDTYFDKVKIVFHNRSSNRTRVAMLEVAFETPAK
jgi:hypothetical protein